MEQFANFDWNNPEWQAYFQNLFPTPPVGKVLKFKKKWYKQHIDSNFDDTAETPTVKNEGPRHHNHQGPSYFLPVWHQRGLVALTASLISLTTSLVLTNIRIPSYALLIAGLFMELYAKFGWPRWSDKIYWQTLLSDTFATKGIIFGFATLSLVKKNPLFMASPVTTAVLLLTQALEAGEPIAEFFPQLIRQKAALVVVQRWQILQMLANIEVMLGVMLIVNLFTRTHSVAYSFLYWNCLRIFYISDPNVRLAVHNMSNRVRSLLMYVSPVVAGYYDRAASFVDGYASGQR
ncbi:MAG: hypothetical protein KVP17_003359 [Porospora cf. gigantea B]|uniref:uncharacterized protein n=1 Tax=Porospora cf. gigantea B TaxID=2853592 RepID=UPI0035719147|nr:MAG: hypothetical protein KVP17_003359 [Porospora cf. gigantea B]